MQYSAYEVNRAHKQLAPMLSRKLGTAQEVEEYAAQFLQDLNGGHLLEKVEWLITGSYGSEYRDLLIHDYVTSPRKKQALKRICINAFMYTCLIDYEALNSRKITLLLKASGKMDQVNSELLEFMDNYGGDHWGI